MGRILAIDYGRKRTGLAVTDSLRITANPLITIPTHTLEAWLTDYFSSAELQGSEYSHDKHRAEHQVAYEILDLCKHIYST